MAPRITMPLQGRVGRHTRDHGRQCQNWAHDQQTVVNLLNCIPLIHGGAIGLIKQAVSGICSDELYRAISGFEDKHFPGQRKGYVDPGGAVHGRMKSLAVTAAQVTPDRTDAKPKNSPAASVAPPSLHYTPKFEEATEGKEEYDEDHGTITLKPQRLSLPIMSRLKQFGGVGGNDLTDFERRLIDDFQKHRLSNYRLITDAQGKIYGYVIQEGYYGNMSLPLYIHQDAQGVYYYGRKDIYDSTIYRGTFSREGVLVDSQDFSPHNGETYSVDSPIDYIFGGFVAGRTAGLLVKLAPRATAVAAGWIAGTNVGEAITGKTSGVNPLALASGDFSAGRRLSSEERGQRVVAGVGTAAVFAGAARGMQALGGAAKVKPGAGELETLTAGELKTIRGGTSSGKPPLISAADLNKPVAQIKDGMGRKLMLNNDERSGVRQILNVLERLRANSQDVSPWKDIGNRVVKKMEYGKYKDEGWIEIYVLEGNPGWATRIRVIFRVVNGDLEAKLLQVH